MDTLPTTQYLVGNFFSAVHAVVTSTMPPDRPLMEYIVILILIAKLLSRLICHIRPKIHPAKSKALCNSIGLLAVHSTDAALSLSIAAIGFSASGITRHRRALIKSRKSNLRQLTKVAGIERITDWAAGNCAETETFAHIPGMQQELLQRAEEQKLDDPKILCVGLTLKLEKLDVSQLDKVEGKEFCELCRELAQNMSQELHCPIVDLCPPP